MTSTDIARVCHEVNRAYCLTLGDDSHLPWEAAPEWQKQSDINGVEFLCENIQMTAEELHQNWMDHKVKEGWVWGIQKNEETKEHPNLVPFSLLPRVQQAKDYLFRAVVRSILGF